MSFYLSDYNYSRHNEEVQRVWEAYNAGRPERVPVVLGVNPRVYLLNPELNPEALGFKDYCENPDITANVQMRTQHYIRHHLLQDAEMGLPSDGWRLAVDFQNCYEAGWFGCPIEYRTGQVPDAVPVLDNDNKRALFDRGIPDPFTGGLMKQIWSHYEHLQTNLAFYSYEGVPAAIVSPPPGLGTDGPMTVACSLRGATEMCLELYADPDYARELLSFITEATITRILAFRREFELEPKPQRWWFADDSIELLSLDTYREFVLPMHRRLLDELAGDGPHSVHLCGNVQRLMPTLQHELAINSWDTGFPVDFGRAREELGEDFTIFGGPPVSLLLAGTPRQVTDECRRILESGVTRGGKFVLREGNNLSPCTPVENLAAMYASAKSFGAYSEGSQTAR